MRPIKLTMQAFGPYARTETIDFTELGNRTMFVISGKTGSGKTTIFDGISYAIYGKASGEDRNGPELRSQFAPDDLPTEVSLQFSLRGKNYFIKRSPQQEKKKERGDGYRLVGATAELYQFDDQGEMQLIAAKVIDVEEKIKEIMLIDSNQFRQILMIPQGEFRKLLTSDSKDKEVILQRLFHTEMYKLIEEKLKEEATVLKKSVEKQEGERDQLIKKITALFNEELQSYVAAGSVNDVIILPLLEDEIEKMTTQLEIVSKEIKDKEKDKELTSQKLYEAENIVKQMKTRDELGVKKSFLEGEKPVFESKEKEIQLAKKAAQVSQQEELCHRLNTEKNILERDLEARQQRLEELKLLLQKREETLTHEKEKEGERKAAQEAIHTLQQIKDEVHSYAAVENEVASIGKELEQFKRQLTVAEGNSHQAEERLKVLQQEREALEKVDILLLENERKVEKLQGEYELIKKYELQLEKYQEHSLLLEKKKGFFGQAEARLQDARALVSTLETKWLHGQAANLARELRDGEACPVCGSEHHPNPANLNTSDMPDEQDLKGAKEQVVGLEQEKTRAETSFLEIQSRVIAMSDSLHELQVEIVKVHKDFSKETLEPLKNYILDQGRTLKSEQQKLKQGQVKFQEIVKEISAYEEKKAELTTILENLKTRVNETSILFAEKNTKLDGTKSRIPKELRSIQAFDRKWKEAGQKLEMLQRQFELAEKQYRETKEHYTSEEAGVVTVQKHVNSKDAELNVERALFLSQMAEQGFAKYNEYKDAKRSEEQISLLEREVRDYYEELRSVTDRFNELFDLLKDLQIPDMDAIYQQLKEVQEQITLLNDQYTTLLIKKRDNEEIRDSITRINAEIKTMEERYKLVGDLYDISRGQNELKITFERYVLAAFLDDILREANGRLLKMTSGRYEMIRKTDRAKGNAQSGLELLVFDQYTGQERHVKTLSGGESFKAALSLALGLADVVQNYAGGVSLETMFIDEGFGTLDPESLDQAIEALIDIQSSGRLVGIISHVPELRERIDARLEVTATQSGSSTQFHFLN